MSRDGIDTLALARELVSDRSRWLGIAAGEDEQLPTAVTSWLAALALLEGIPFDYLVPDDRALPLESLRFFYLDPTWLAAVQDGAMSVGRSEQLDLEHDTGVAAWARAKAHLRRPELRAGLLRREAATVTSGVTSGFLLRSALVEGWPGLEVVGYSDQTYQTPLTTLRQALLSPSVMIALFDGAIQSVQFSEPSEGIQFGANPPAGAGQPFVVEQIRHVSGGATVIGTEYQGTNTTNVPMLAPTKRPGALPGVVDVVGLEQQLQQTLTTAGGTDQLSPGTTAIQLGEQPLSFVLTLTNMSAASGAPVDPDALSKQGEASLAAFLEEKLAP
jgi:hypothetical protein